MSWMTSFFLLSFGVLFGVIGVGAGVAAARSHGDRLQLAAATAVLVVVLIALAWLGVSWIDAQCNPPPGSACA